MTMEIKPENAEVRVDVDGKIIIVVTLTEEQKTLVFGEPVRHFSIREDSEVLQVETRARFERGDLLEAFSASRRSCEHR